MPDAPLTDWINKIDWLWWLGAVWPVFVAIPGAVAFLWQWRDRREKAHSRHPYVEVRTAERYGFKPANGFTPIDFRIRNDADVPIKIIGVEVIWPRGCVMTVHPQSQPSLRLSPGWTVQPRAWGPSASPPWVLHMASRRQQMSKVQLVIRLTFKEMSATARTSRVRVTSSAITLTVAKTDITR